MYIAPGYPLTASLGSIPSGRAGARATVRRMRGLVNEYKIDPRVISMARGLVYLSPEFDDASEIRVLFDAVSNGVKYVKDVSGIETLADPVTTLNSKMGDCDDQSTALATLLESVGYPTRFVIAGYQSKNFEHVYLQVWAFDNWIDLDPTEHNGIGWAPPAPQIIEYEKV